MKRLETIFSASCLLAALGCSSSSPPSHTTPPDEGEDAGETPPPMKRDAAADRAIVADAKGSGGDGGAGGADASVAGDDAGGGGTLDAGVTPDAYIRTTGGPFGLNARPGPQTCKPPADFEMPAAMLSDTGCVDKTDPKKPAASLIPYDVNSPLWSDGAAKQRFMAIPDGAVIHVKDCAREPALCKPKAQGGTTENDGHWTLPVGTVLVKHFQFNGKFLETRLFVRFADQWAGYSYAWNDAQTDATIVDSFGVHKMIAGPGGKMQDWFFPARQDCLTCHNKSVGFSLGPETLQMNKNFTYPGGMANQIATLEHIGLFDGPVPTMVPLLDPASSNTPATLEARARSYLHANCAICHRPEGDYPDVDMRFSVSFKDTSLCNVDPNKGDLGVMGAKRLVPATPAKSVMYLRMLALDKKTGRMPQLATSVIDPLGTKLISDWITRITTCP
jgi:uncharacterized repeat protein (TIGR03806 family)